MTNTKYIVTGYYPKPYRTKANDTFDMIAYRLYNDEAVASYLIEANPQYADVIQFDNLGDVVRLVYNENNEV